MKKKRLIRFNIINKTCIGRRNGLCYIFHRKICNFCWQHLSIRFYQSLGCVNTIDRSVQRRQRIIGALALAPQVNSLAPQLFFHFYWGALEFTLCAQRISQVKKLAPKVTWGVQTTSLHAPGSEVNFIKSSKILDIHYIFFQTICNQQINQQRCKSDLYQYWRTTANFPNSGRVSGKFGTTSPCIYHEPSIQKALQLVYTYFK